MSKRGRLGHTIEHRGARVIVTLVDGTSFVDRFIERAKHRRWILLKEHGRVPMSTVANVSRVPADRKTGE